MVTQETYIMSVKVKHSWQLHIWQLLHSSQQAMTATPDMKMMITSSNSKVRASDAHRQTVTVSLHVHATITQQPACRAPPQEGVWLAGRSAAPPQDLCVQAHHWRLCLEQLRLHLMLQVQRLPMTPGGTCPCLHATQCNVGSRADCTADRASYNSFCNNNAMVSY